VDGREHFKAGGLGRVQPLRPDQTLVLKHLGQSSVFPHGEAMARRRLGAVGGVVDNGGEQGGARTCSTGGKHTNGREATSAGHWPVLSPP
jgi:hypothetical protein